MKKRIVKNKLLLRILIMILIAFLLGLFYLAILSKTNKGMIQENLNLFFSSIKDLDYVKGLINSLTTNLIYVALIWILGISIIGVPIIIFLLLTKSFILGFSISSIIYFYQWKGIIIALIYSIPLIFNLFFLFFLGYYGILFSKNLNQLLFMKKNINFKDIMRKYLRILLFTTIGIIISSILEIYLIPNLLKLLQIS